jgi:hypothetical protein
MNKRETLLEQRLALVTHPPEQPDWNQIRDRGTRNRSVRRGRIAALVALATVASAVPLAALAGVGSGWWFLKHDNQHAVRRSSVVELRSGRWNGVDWQLVGFVRKGWGGYPTVCVAFNRGTNSENGACGAIRAAFDGKRNPHAQWIFFLNSPGITYQRQELPDVLTGAIASSATVQVRLLNGRLAEPALIRPPATLGARVRYFVYRVPANTTVATVIVRDSQGRVVQRVS